MFGPSLVFVSTVNFIVLVACTNSSLSPTNEKGTSPLRAFQIDTIQTSHLGGLVSTSISINGTVFPKAGRAKIPGRNDIIYQFNVTNSTRINVVETDYWATKIYKVLVLVFLPSCCCFTICYCKKKEKTNYSVARFLSRSTSYHTAPVIPTDQIALSLSTDTPSTNHPFINQITHDNPPSYSVAVNMSVPTRTTTAQATFNVQKNEELPKYNRVKHIGLPIVNF